jgi:hypothetical protein
MTNEQMMMMMMMQNQAAGAWISSGQTFVGCGLVLVGLL